MLQRVRRSLALLISLGAVALLGGCGGGGGDSEGPKTFSDSDFGITFKYPGSFEETDDITVSSSAGGSSTARKGLKLGRYDVIVVTRFPLNFAVTEKNLARVKSEVDRVVGQAAGTTLSGEKVDFGGLPGYEYEFDVSKPTDARSRFVVLFDGKTEYTINCQATEEKREELNEGCTMILDTLETKD